MNTTWLRQNLCLVVKDNVNSVSIKRVVRERDESQSTGKVPTLLKGYLKVGARVSDRAVIDPVFNTTFVAIYVITGDMFSSNHSLAKHSF